MTSFVLYTETAQHIDLLSDEDAGKLFKALFLYAEAGVQPTDLQPAAAMAFSFIRAYMDANSEKYEEKRKKRSEAGKLGAAASNSKRSAKAANAGIAESDAAKAAVSGSVSGSVFVSDTELEKSTPEAPKRRYGSYQNVLLSDDDRDKLQQEFPADWSTRIERLSEYMASSGRSYRNHLATIRSWARGDKTKQKPVAALPDYTAEEEFSL